MTTKKNLVLASQSPRRSELLKQLGYEFICESADIDETVKPNESPLAYVDRLAREKAQVIANNYSNDTVVLGSDTSVVVDGNILGKPENKSAAIAMLTMLSGRQHQVITAIAATDNTQVLSKCVITDVYFKPLSVHEIEQYWQSGEPQDKAGSYAIQGIGGQFVKQIQGSYSSVVGLPLYETAQLLAKFGLPTSLQAKQ